MGLSTPFRIIERQGFQFLRLLHPAGGIVVFPAFYNNSPPVGGRAQPGEAYSRVVATVAWAGAPADTQTVRIGPPTQKQAPETAERGPRQRVKLKPATPESAWTRCWRSAAPARGRPLPRSETVGRTAVDEDRGPADGPGSG